MANSIQAMRQVYDIVKSARDNDKPFTDEDIKRMLEQIVSDKSLIDSFPRFQKGYAAEDLFMRIYSLLPWVSLITPLGQEQYPEVSKEKVQVSDYIVNYEIGSPNNMSKILVEVKLVDGDKETFELEKYKFDVLNRYSKQNNIPMVYALFWRKNLTWTVNCIESFSEKSSIYKISYMNACLDDLSAIFGDYTYVFRKKCFRKSKFSKNSEVETKYFHSHKKYGRTIYEGLSLDGKNYTDLNFIEPALLDAVFDFEQIKYCKISDTEVETIEGFKADGYVYKLSSLLMAFLVKIYCLERDDMYFHDNDVVRNAFDIVDIIRQKCGGEKYYSLPYNITQMSTNLLKEEFGEKSRIFNTYLETVRCDNLSILCPHK